MEKSSVPIIPKKLRCTIIGAGVSGLLMAYKLHKHLGDHVVFAIYEKSPELGGTWFENRYPGCACDVPSHVYQFSFAPNPNWSRLYVTDKTHGTVQLELVVDKPRSFASSSEIQAYLKGVAETFDLERFIHYNSEVTSARWSEASGTWTLTVNDQDEVESEILVNAGGILNNPQIPDLEGISSFSGPQLHTAAWDSSINLTGKRVAVIGAGASAIQLLPQVQSLASHVDVYIRTPSWITPPVGLETCEFSNPIYTEAEIDRFKRDKRHYLQVRKNLEANFNSMFRAFMKLSPEQQSLRARLEQNMKTLIQSPALQKKLIPDFEAGCRRMNPGEPYLRTLQEHNVQPVFSSIDRITTMGVVAEGVERPCDVLILATGFNTSFRPRFSIFGRENVNLQELWARMPVSYMGTGVAGFPNYLTYLGPNTPISNGSLMGTLEATSDYFIRLLRKVIRQRVKSFDVRANVQQDFDHHTQAVMKNMVWTGSCRSWFKQGVEGKVTALWPGSSLHYMQTLAENRWEDYHWTYNDGRFAYWGQGISWVEDSSVDILGREERESLSNTTTIPLYSGDVSYYLWESDPVQNRLLATPPDRPGHS